MSGSSELEATRHAEAACQHIHGLNRATLWERDQIPASIFRIDWQVPADFDLATDVADGTLEGRIRAIIGDRPYEIVRTSVYRFHARCVDRMRVGRVLLAGDCAHLVAPFGARGLNSGVADAENAAWKLAFVLHGWAPDVLLDSY